MKINPNDPAFPVVNDDHRDGYSVGLPARLWIATQLLASHLCDVRRADKSTKAELCGHYLHFADEMIRAHNATVEEVAKR